MKTFPRSTGGFDVKPRMPLFDRRGFVIKFVAEAETSGGAACLPGGSGWEKCKRCDRHDPIVASKREFNPQRRVLLFSGV